VEGLQVGADPLEHLRSRPLAAGGLDHAEQVLRHGFS